MHLVIIQHGFMDLPIFSRHFDFLESDNVIVKICDLNHTLYSMQGIKKCGRRLNRFTRENLETIPEITEISFIGHSFGGLIIRYAIVLMSDIFETIKPIFLITLGTPHLKITLTPPKYMVLATNTTGRQILGIKNTLCEMLSEEYMSFIDHFQTVIFYGNKFNDVVPLKSACMIRSQFTITAYKNRLYQVNVTNKDRIVRRMLLVPEYTNSHFALVSRCSIPIFLTNDPNGQIVFDDIKSEFEKHEKGELLK